MGRWNAAAFGRHEGTNRFSGLWIAPGHDAKVIRPRFQIVQTFPDGYRKCRNSGRGKVWRGVRIIGYAERMSKKQETNMLSDKPVHFASWEWVL
jgi:hypothetical protein